MNTTKLNTLIDSPTKKIYVVLLLAVSIYAIVLSFRKPQVIEKEVAIDYEEKFEKAVEKLLNDAADYRRQTDSLKTERNKVLIAYQKMLLTPKRKLRQTPTKTEKDDIIEQLYKEATNK